MFTLRMKYIFGVLCLTGLSGCVLSLQCYEFSCNGTNCLGTEVVSNPLLIKKCGRIIYKGCYTVTTSFSGFTLTTAGCVDRMFQCSAGTCSGAFLKTEVFCCNGDLCNDGEISSAADTIPVHITQACIILCLLFIILITQI